MSRRLAQTEDRARYEWIRSHTTSSAVFLSSDEDALRIAGPAGCSAVCVSPAFSNLYVSYEERAAARDRLFALVADGDRAGFISLARTLGVTHLLALDGGGGRPSRPSREHVRRSVCGQHAGGLPSA